MNLGDVRAHAWSLVSQSASSGRSILFAVVAARLLDADDFGLVAIVVGGAIAANGLLRASSSHPLALVDDPPPGDVLTAAVRHHVALATVGAGVLAVVAIAACAPGELIAGAALFPLVALHDGVRISALNLGRGVMAAAVDGAWVLLLGAALVWAIVGDEQRPTVLLVVWALSAGASAAVVLFAHRRIDGRPVVGVCDHRDAYEASGRRLAWQLLLESIPVRMLPLVVTAVIAVRDTGALRGAESLLGGATIVWSAVSLSVLRQARGRARDHGDVAAFRLVAAVNAVASLAVVVNAVIVVALPDDVGEQVLGDTWAGASEIMPAVAALLLAQVVLGAVATWQRATGRDTDVRRMLSVAAVASLATVPASAGLFGVRAALLVDAGCLVLAGGLGAWWVRGGPARERTDDDHEERPARAG